MKVVHRILDCRAGCKPAAGWKPALGVDCQSAHRISSCPTRSLEFKLTNYRILPVLGSVLLIACVTATAQNTPEMREVLNRLDRIEKQNQALNDEVQALRKELAVLRSAPSGAAGAATDGQVTPREAAADDRLAVEQNRVEELAQTKVEASQKFPLRVTGMALFNAYLNGRHNNQATNPTIASFLPADATGGATLRQSTLGLLFDGPMTVAGAKVSGSLYMDFFGGSTNSLNHLFRLRTAAINLDWTNSSLMFGQSKPIISPRDPDSLAQVGVSPLTSAGNPWLWQPQVRFEQRMQFGNSTGLVAQLGVFQTSVLNATPDPDYAPTADGSRVEYSQPGGEGRVEFWRRWGDAGRLEIAGGMHVNRNHFGIFSLPSNVYSTDWFFRPIAKLEFSGMFFHGRNVTTLGALRPGFNVLPNRRWVSIPSTGGWAQVRLPVTSRLAFDFYGGQQDDLNADLVYGNISKNQGYFANVMCRLAPNVIISLEGGQLRTTYFGVGTRLNDHYDLAIGYLF